jgi:Xaa-Pro aminopeptidase
MMDRRAFLATTSAAAAGSAFASTAMGGAQSSSSASTTPVAAPAGKSAGLFLPVDDLKPATFDRLPLEWNKRQVAKLQKALVEDGYDGILLSDRWNIIYFTGLWHTTTERPFHAFIPAQGSHPVWFFPALDRDLVHSWWYDDGETYFDFPHAQGAYPHEGKVQMGPTVDLFEWVMTGLKKRGYAGKNLAADRELTPSLQKRVVKVLGKEMGSEEPLCMGMRMRKTPEELALMRRAYNYFNQMHAFGRDLLLEKGTDLTDFDIASAATKYGTDLVMADIKRDGTPHTAVGISVTVSCRTGKATAYPHPNQFNHNKVKKGQSLQIEGAVKIGGCGGELYRQFLISPWTDHMKHVWTTVRDGCMMQQKESIAGVTGSVVAYKIHKFQVENGVAKYIYHRPAHGEGMEGHQTPYLALGDYTMLEPGMCFSVEPGLFDPENGFGVNFSDVFVVEPTGPSRQMSRMPWSEEYCLVTL